MTDTPQIVEPDGEPSDPTALDRIADDAELVPYQRPAVFPAVDEFAFVMQMAEALSKSNLVPKACVGKPGDVAIVLLAARDLGIPMTQVFAKLHVIEGKLSISAEMMIALALRDGHRVWCEELTAQSATACAQRRGSEHVARFTFTIEDAELAQLLGKDNWKKYPKAMLWARACSGVVRMELPDVLAGVTYTPEEMGDEDRWTAHPASSLDRSVREEFAARANALPELRQVELKQAWRTWGLNPIARLTVEEEAPARELIGKAEAIEAREAPEGSESGEGPDGPPVVSEAPTVSQEQPRTASVADAVDTPDPTAISHDADLDGPAVFNGDTGYCTVCGSSIWFDVDHWTHSDDTDQARCPGVRVAGPGENVDSAYALYHPSTDPHTMKVRIEAEVGALTQTKLVKAVAEAGLPADGSPKTMRERLVAYRLESLAAESAAG